MPELHVLTGDGAERVIPLDDRPVTFGRDETCDVVLDEKRASRRHCTFHPGAADPDKGGWRVVDEGSSNGTHLGGKPVLAARLQPGDELEIGETVITYVAESVTPVRRRRAAAKRPAWGLLAMPVLFGFAAYVALGAFESASAESREATWEAAARAAVERADLPSQAERRDELLSIFAATLPSPDVAPRAHAIVASARESGGPGGGGGSAALAAAVSELRATWDQMAPVQRRTRLAELLERNVGDRDAMATLRGLLERLAGESSRATEADRRRTEERAAAAVEEGRLGDALDAWNGWLLRAPTLGHVEEKAVAARLDELTERAREAATKALDEARRMRDGGDAAAAASHVTDTVERLRGTGYDVWLAARTRHLSGAGAEAAVPALDVVRRTGSPAKERTLVLRALSSAEDLARLRLFADAAKQLEDALPGVGDAALREELGTRLADLRAEAAIVATVLAQVSETPRAFSPLRLEDGAWTLNGATGDTLLVARKDESAARSLGELPTSVLAHLFAKARLDERGHADAALVLWDVGERDAYVREMRIALATEDDVLRNEISAVHARLDGKRMPDGGYVPHPDADGGIISWDELCEIRNAEKIAEYTKELEKIVASVESSAQAKQIEKVRRAYQELEKARDHALELIFDEVRYFYPYRDRMKEYMPVKLDVDRRVKLVEEAWDDGTRVNVKRDSKMERWLERAEELRVEIGYLRGDTAELDARLEAIERYLGHELTVRSFFETPTDRRLHEHNAAVMAENAVKETVATDDEREQVRVTNEYRIMMGHRRALRINDQLTHAARGHSADMSRLGFFDHFSPVPGKRAPADRIKAEGYPLAGASENIHRGSGDPMGAHLSWRGSSGHHRNLLMPSWYEMGTGRDGRNWTQNFGFTEAHLHED